MDFGFFFSNDSGSYGSWDDLYGLVLLDKAKENNFIVIEFFICWFFGEGKRD